MTAIHAFGFVVLGAFVGVVGMCLVRFTAYLDVIAENEALKNKCSSQKIELEAMRTNQ